MKISICSDIHLEFGPIELVNKDGADVLVLSGDICIANDLLDVDNTNVARSNKFHEFFQQCSNEFQSVMYVSGNHEHYHGDFAKTHQILFDRLSYLPNIFVLDKEIVTDGDVMFVGSTLWTDMDNGNERAINNAHDRMNDYVHIDNSNRMVNYKVPSDPLNRNSPPVFKTRPGKFSPQASIDEHEHCIGFIRDVVDDNPTKTIVVVGHHAPSLRSLDIAFGRDPAVYPAYASNLDDFIRARPQIKLWTHGHIHCPQDYMIGQTRIVSNPRGYIGYENCANNFNLKTVEI